MNLEVWALDVIYEGRMSGDEFTAEIPRIAVLLKIIKPDGLKKMLVDATMRGQSLSDVLTDIENINDILFSVVQQGKGTFGGLKETLNDG